MQLYMESDINQLQSIMLICKINKRISLYLTICLLTVVLDLSDDLQSEHVTPFVIWALAIGK